jgi:hypothetical protein
MPQESARRFLLVNSDLKLACLRSADLRRASPRSADPPNSRGTARTGPPPDREVNSNAVLTVPLTHH